jgi:hypothetical protein
MVNASHSSKKSRPIVNADCPFVFAFCNGSVLKPLPGARFERVCSIEEFLAAPNGEGLLSIAEAARRSGFKAKTIYCWIENQKLRNEHGLRTIGKRHRIEWPIFKACLDRGDFAGDFASCS